MPMRGNFGVANGMIGCMCNSPKISGRALDSKDKDLPLVQAQSPAGDWLAHVVLL